MKKISKIALVLVAMFFSVSQLFAAADRAHTLKVYNWADYIDEDILDEFEQWYFEQTGEEVEIIYQLFDINEIMLSKIERGHEDYDVACPSDYIIERMMRAGLLLPINKDFGETPNYIDGNIAPFIKESFSKIDGNGKDVNDYAVGYMWGTTGILYNEDKVTREEASTWNVIHNPKFDGQIFIKDAFRDVYSPILMYLKQDELASGAITREELMYDASDESIAMVEQYLIEGKDLIAGWEADFGKEQMAKGNGALNLSWSGDAGWAIEEAELVGVNLDYVIPKEGSNIWFDGWVIPKYAVNTKAASYFINFLCRPDNAIRISDYIGYVSVIGGEEMLEHQIDSTKYAPIDVSYFFGEGTEAMCVNPVKYPDLSDIENCVMMHDTGDRTENMLAMWSRVKGDNANTTTYIIIIVVAVAIIAAVIISRSKKKSRKNHRRK